MPASHWLCVNVLLNNVTFLWYMLLGLQLGSGLSLGLMLGLVLGFNNYGFLARWSNIFYCMYLCFPPVSIGLSLCHWQLVSNGKRSHAHTVVWERCKDDHQSQWERANFDPQLTLNPLTDRHQIWITWLYRGYLPPNKIWAQSVRGFFLPIYVKYTP